ncbi:MAG TPA: hypothetical protein VF228_16630 [Iamia sp.]
MGVYSPEFGSGWGWVVAGGCVAVAVASLLVPATNGYDPWAWLVWGRQAGRLELDTTHGPSWKPLPVLVTTALSVFGGAAPALWLVVARTAGLAAIVGCYRLAARQAGALAGVAAGGLLVLTPDGDPRYLRLVLEGHSAPATAALAVWAVERHLAGRPGPALALATALALDRPEAWPFLGLYALWSGRRREVPWWAVATALGSVPGLWFGGDLWGSGDLWHGAGVAQVYADDPDRFGDSLVRVADVAAAPTWVGAGIAVVLAVRARDRVVLALGAGALAWIGLVVGMATALGYAAVGRFLLPAAALLCVLAGIGGVRLVALVGPGRPRVAVAAAVLLVALLGVVPRADDLGREVRRIGDRDRFEEEVELALAVAGGPDAVTACRRVAVDEDSPARTSLTWMLDVPLGETKRALLGRPGVVFDRRGTPTAVALEGSTDPGVVVLARTDDWVVVAVDCPGAG